MDDIRAVVTAARQLTIKPRAQRWAHLSLCVLDAVFSIGARYSTTCRTCHRYAEHAELVTPLVDVTAVPTVIGTANEQSLVVFVHDVTAHGLGWLGQVLGRPCTIGLARNLLTDASEQLCCTPWELDHAIWNARRTRRSVAS